MFNIKQTKKYMTQEHLLALEAIEQQHHFQFSWAIQRDYVHKLDPTIKLFISQPFHFPHHEHKPYPLPRELGEVWTVFVWMPNDASGNAQPLAHIDIPSTLWHELPTERQPRKPKAK